MEITRTVEVKLSRSDVIEIIKDHIVRTCDSSVTIDSVSFDLTNVADSMSQYPRYELTGVIAKGTPSQ